MTALNDKLRTLTQSSAALGTLSTREDMQRFRQLVERDIAKLMSQLNEVYFPIVNVLSDNALSGLYGDRMITASDAENTGNPLYYSTAAERALSVRESFDQLAADLLQVKTDLQLLATYNRNAEDLSGLTNQSAVLQLRQGQLKTDTFGGNYTYTTSGGGRLDLPLAQAIEAIGQNFSGWPGIGVSGWTNSFPELNFEIALSNILVDTSLPQTAIDDLDTDLDNIRGFVGMTAADDTTTEYSAYGTLINLTDGDTLEEAAAKLDINKISKTAFAGTHIGQMIRTSATTYQVIRINVTNVAPSATADAANNYSVGSRWFDTTADREYVCIDDTTNAAVWLLTGTAPLPTTLTANTSVVANERKYIVNVSGGGFNLVLPASPTEGFGFEVLPGAGDLGINNVLIRNSANTTTLYTMQLTDVGLTVRYLGGNWKFKPEIWVT